MLNPPKKLQKARRVAISAEAAENLTSSLPILAGAATQC
jgi:hypothetical protein